RVPRRQIFCLLLLFLGLLPVGLAAAAWLPGLHGLRPDGFWENLHVALFYVAVSLGYIVTYSALEEDSPTLTVVAFVADAGGRGGARAVAGGGGGSLQRRPYHRVAVPGAAGREAAAARRGRLRAHRAGALLGAGVPPVPGALPDAQGGLTPMAGTYPWLVVAP